jgi:hypothetical protein
MVDRNMAIDQAFMVCKTEESKLQAFEKTSSVSAHRAERRTLAAIDVEDRATGGFGRSLLATATIADARL